MFYFDRSNESIEQEAKDMYDNLIKAGESIEIAQILVESFILCYWYKYICQKFYGFKINTMASGMKEVIWYG